MSFIPVMQDEFLASFLQSSVSHDLQKSYGNADLLLKKHFWLALVDLLFTGVTLEHKPSHR